MMSIPVSPFISFTPHIVALKFLDSKLSYYNNVPNLKEVFRLRHNVSLRELDLRLNPVTKDEPDYRLFVIHMLVNLRKLGVYIACA